MPSRPVWKATAHHPGGNPGANLKSISHRCHPILVAFVWQLTKETINLPLGCLSCLQGGERKQCLNEELKQGSLLCYLSHFMRCTIREECSPWILLPFCASLTSLRYSARACQTGALSRSVPSLCRTLRGLLPAWHLPSRKKIIQRQAQSGLCEQAMVRCTDLPSRRAAGAAARRGSHTQRWQLLWGVPEAGCAAPSPRTAQAGRETG